MEADIAAQVGNLQVRVGADITGLVTGMGRAQREVSRGARGMQKSVSDLQLTFKEVATTAGRSLRVIGGAFAIGFGVREIMNVADAAKNLSAQLRLATSQYGSFAQANKDVQTIAQTTRSDLLATAELYSALQRNSDQFGASQAQVARITQTVSEAFKISGSSADEASNATRQLVQAFQSGRLQGDEFRSIMENAPRLARALADSLGVTVGKLREMSKEGTLTAAALVKAFSDEKITAGIDAEFKQLPVTFDQAMGQVYNAAVITFGEFDRGGQFSTALANFMTDGTAGFADLGKAAFDFGADTRALLDTLDGVRDAFAGLKTEGIGALLGLETASFGLRDALSTVLGVVDGMANAFANLFNAPGNLVRGIMGKPLVLDPVNMRGTFNKSVQAADLRRISGTGLDPSEWGTGKKPPAFHAPPASGGSKGRKGPSAETLAKRAEREAEQKMRRDAAFASEERRGQIQLLQADRDLATSATSRNDISLKILDLETQQELAEIDLSVKLKDRTANEAEILRQQVLDLDQLKRIQLQHEEDRQKIEDAGKIQDARFDVAHDQLQAESALATTASEARDIELRILDLEYQRERAALERLAADQDATDAAREEARIRLAGLDARYQAERAGVMARTRGPLEQWAASIPKTTADIKEAIDANIVDSLDNAAEAAGNLTKKILGMKGPVADLAATFATMLAKMLLFRALSGIMGGFGGAGGLSGGGGIPTFTPSNPGVGFASGGSFTVMGRKGIDKNMLSLNGIPIANVSYGERIGVANDNQGGGGTTVVVHQHNNFAGGAVTQDDLVRMHQVTVAAAKSAVNEQGRRSA